MCVYMERVGGGYFKELAHMMVGFGKSEIYRSGQQAENLPVSVDVAV